MKRYNFYLFVHIISLMICVTGIAVSSIYGYYLLTVMSAMLLTVSIYYFITFMKRVDKDMNRLIDAIRFNEFNVAFSKFDYKGLNPSLAQRMEDSVVKFNKRIQDAEGEQIFYDTLLNRIDAGLMVLDASKQVKWINKAALDMLGKPQPRVLSDLNLVSTELTLVLEAISPRETRTVRIRNGKNEYSLLVTAVLLNIKGQELKLISLKNIQTALDENESEAWKKLIRVLTHEMMNSIAPIISLAETFSKPTPEYENSDMIYGAMQTIHRRSKGLVEFVNNYKKITHIPVPQYTVFKAQEIMSDITNLLTADGVQFSVLINPANVVFDADRNQMEQVLINLIKNAWQAASENENPEVKVEIATNEYRKPVITISDNGYGIPAELLDKIFIPFFTTKKDGSGIGLSICRQIINAHGGTISVISEQDKGSVFIIRL